MNPNSKVIRSSEARGCWGSVMSAVVVHMEAVHMCACVCFVCVPMQGACVCAYVGGYWSSVMHRPASLIRCSTQRLANTQPSIGAGSVKLVPVPNQPLPRHLLYQLAQGVQSSFQYSSTAAQESNARSSAQPNPSSAPPVWHYCTGTPKCTRSAVTMCPLYAGGV